MVISFDTNACAQYRSKFPLASSFNNRVLKSRTNGFKNLGHQRISKAIDVDILVGRQGSVMPIHIAFLHRGHMLPLPS